jgi:hypothetical protein
MRPHALPDGSELIEPIPCDRCGALSYFILRLPHPDKPDAEIHTFQCPACGNRMQRGDQAESGRSPIHRSDDEAAN